MNAAIKPPHPACGHLLPRYRERRDSDGLAQSDSNFVAWRIVLQGRVQGMGVRPVIARLAAEFGLTGFVSNTSDGVLIQLEGDGVDGRRFIELLPEKLPHSASYRMTVEPVESLLRSQAFEIRKSGQAGPTAADVPVDLAICEDCRRELLDNHDRRFRYSFGSCTNCGPRYSIIRSMPYERAATSMGDYQLCDECVQEYSASHDRRFHAQTIACAKCGPQVWLQMDDCDTRPIADEAIVAADDVIRSGGVLALKGIGGYQLICDATNADAVQKLRRLKHRPSKPLAVMVASCSDIQDGATPSELKAMTSLANPIVVLENIAIESLAAIVSSGLNSIGVFLPSTPLHALIVNEVRRPLVVTSGNVDGDPLVFDQRTAANFLNGLADAVLDNDRTIERPIDDSVVRVIGDSVVTMRAGRGIAPLRLELDTTHRILAVGGDQKVACAVSNGRQTVLGPHIGDMKSVAARERFVEQAKSLQQLYGTQADVIVHDLHPEYFTTRWAAEQPCRTIAVQHHHAHVVAGMVEHGLLDQQVLGVAFDGTGYGTDGTIWGGEFLLATTLGYQRVASLRPFVLPGGDSAVREPWRVAVSLLTDAMPELSPLDVTKLLGHTAGSPCRRLAEGLVREKNSARETSSFGPLTSSMGRLFDGAAALAIGKGTAEFEGQLAMLLEASCGAQSDRLALRQAAEIDLRAVERALLPVAFRDGQKCPSYGKFVSAARLNEGFSLIETDELLRIDWRPLIRRIVTCLSSSPICLRSGTSTASNIATFFHAAIADMIAAVAERFPDSPIVLSGGCFQNRILTEMTDRKLRDQNRVIALPCLIPPNDGGLAAGQIAIATALLDEEQRESNNHTGKL
ncbi:MAG TPA: carbamoyltransferase HypF [Planctomycetaceae bacterium]|nr:carbamoyltransferase HypF [Planctomycetaceae bacterium]